MLKNEKVLLPYSGGRYSVSNECRIYDFQNNEIEIVNINGELLIELNWVLGKEFYQVGLVILSAFNRIGFNDSFYSRIEILYKDGDKSNYFLSNLVYKFSGDPIAVKDNPGFYYIPFFPKYVINKLGHFLNIEKQCIKKWCNQHGESLGNRKPGYQYTTAINCLGNSVAVYQHRLLCIVFKTFSGAVSKLVVNHKDGVKTNNDIDNLEWVTYTQNNKHAWDNGLVGNTRKSVLVKNLRSGEILKFRSARACSTYLGNSTSFYVTERLTKRTTEAFPDLLQFKYDDGKPWITLNTIGVIFTDNKISNIVARNVFTGDFIVFDNVRAGSELTGVNCDTILNHARENKLLPVNGFNFRYMELATDWPKHTANHLLVYRDYPVYPPDGIIAIDNLTKVETFYTSANKCSEKFPIHVAHLRSLIISKTLYKKRYSFKNFKLKHNFGLHL